MPSLWPLGTRLVARPAVACWSVMSRDARPSGCLTTLVAVAIFGVVVYGFMHADPEGDGGGTRFAFLVILGLFIYGCFRFANWISRTIRRERRGFPIEPLAPRGEA
jgi:hypothetical protein